MKLTKYGHACWRLEKDGRTLVIDPGTFSGQGLLDGADAVLITHAHYDHVDPDLIQGSDVDLWTCEEVASELPEGRAHAVAHGDSFEVAGFSVRVFGERHAMNHPDVTPVQNIGFLVEDEVFYPGDALTVPDARVGTLLVPTGGPWLKLGEMIGYLREVKPARAYSTHDALYNDLGYGLLDSWLQGEAEHQKADIRRVHVGDSVTLA